MSVIFTQIQFHATCSPAKPAIMLPDRVISYGMVASGMESVRSVLDGFRIDRNKPVGILIGNSARHIIAGLALIKSGFAIASLRRDLVRPALDSGISTIITDENLPPLEGLRTIQADDFWFNDPRPKQIPAHAIAPDRVIRIAFTSGSTGQPKPIAHTHQLLIERINLTALIGFGRGERVMSTYGVSGPGFMQAIASLMTGRTVCFSPPEQLLSSMLFCGVDGFRGSVGHLRTLLAAQEEFGRPLKLKWVSVGGAHLSFDMAEKVRASFGCEISNSYAAVEGGVIAAASGGLLASHGVRGSCYAPLSEIRICGDDGQELPVGSNGVIHVRSDRISTSFNGALDLTPDRASGGWLKTGDTGRIEADGMLVVTGRADEVINLGGAKYDPEMLEGILMQHPAIGSAAVLRMIGASGNHEAWAFIPASAGLNLETLNAWIATRADGALHALDFTRLIPIESIPKTVSGKVDRGALRKLFAAQA